MELEHTFTVPVPPEQAFTVLQDIERIGPCMPGATIDAVDGKSFTGKVKVKIGPIQVTYAGQAEYASVDADARTAIIKARGKEARGSGTANATVTAAIRAVPDGAEVHVVTDLAITGRPAQFGRGVMEEVGQKLINQFADCLAGTLGEGSDEGSDEGSGEGEGEQRDAEPVGPSGNGSSGAPQAAEVTTAPTRPAGQSDTIDLLDVAGAPVAKRLAPVLGVLVLIIVWWLRRR